MTPLSRRNFLARNGSHENDVFWAEMKSPVHFYVCDDLRGRVFSIYQDICSLESSLHQNPITKARFPRSLTRARTFGTRLQEPSSLAKPMVLNRVAFTKMTGITKAKKTTKTSQTATNIRVECRRSGNRGKQGHDESHGDLGAKYHPNKENYQINSENNFIGTVTGYQSPNNSRRPFCRYP